MTDKAQIDGLRSETVTVDGIRLHYWIGGPADEQPVLLWHGFLSTGYAWRKVATELAAAGMAVLVPDMRGFGDSDKPDGDKGYDARSLAEEFRALVAQIGFGDGKPLIVAAHDMGAPPALIWASDHPEEIAALLYIEAPVMLQDVLEKIIAYNRQAMAQGSMWWWILPLAPGVPEALIVGNERAFLEWFYKAATVHPEVFDDATVEEYLRTFCGRRGVLGAMGVYRAAFDSIDQTAPLTANKVKLPIIALGGKQGLGGKVGEMVSQVAENVTTETFAESGHFLPEEYPDPVIRHIRAIAAKLPAATDA